jgi:putative transposase
MRLVFSTPGKPRGRGRIERFFQTVNQLLLCELPGYSPPNGAACGEPQLTLPELDKRFREFLLGTYHRREHGDTRIPPQERWDKGGFLPQMPDTLEQLDLLLMTVAKSRRIRPDGIHFLGMRYIDPTLAAYVGEDVILSCRLRPVHAGKLASCMSAFRIVGRAAAVARLINLQ